MRISLIDVDSKIPNLALMKISAYHKQKGDAVGFNLRNPDKIYSSIIFKKNRGKAFSKPLDGIEVIYGGSGFDLSVKLPDEIEYLKPDYDLYPSSFSQGFTTRGCIRNCHFCLVPIKEGKLVHWQHPKEFYDGRFDTMMIMDNNWLADRDWFFETSQWIIDNDLTVIEGGMDVRLIDNEIIEQLKNLHMSIWHFAFDYTSIESIVREKIQLLQDCNISTKNSCLFYVYCSGDESYADALYRCNVLRSIHATPFLMFDPEYQKTGRIKRLIKWVNRPQLFWSIPFDSYSRLCHT